MSVASVVKYSMTLDGAQYMQELRRAIAETKAAEKAIADESKAMGVIKVSALDMRAALANGSEAAGGLANGMIVASSATRGFNAAQTAFSHAMSGNFIGAANAGAAAVRGFTAALAANPIMIAAVALGAVALGIKKIVDEIGNYRDRMREIQAEHDAFIADVSKMEGTDPDSVLKKKIASGGMTDIKNMQTEYESRAAYLRQHMLDSETHLRNLQRADAKTGWIPGISLGDHIRRQSEQLEVEKSEYQDALTVLKELEEAEERINKTRQDARRESIKQFDEKMEQDRAETSEINRKRAALNEMREEARRKDVESGLSGDVAKLTYRKGMLELDNRMDAEVGVDADTRRFQRSEKIKELDGKIFEAKKTSEQKTKDAEKQAKADRLNTVAVAAEAAAAAAKEKADNAEKAANEAMAEFRNPGAKAKADKKAEQDAEREWRHMEELVKRGENGARGKHIDAARAALEAAVAENIADTDRTNKEFAAQAAREAAEAAMAENIGKIAEATAKTAERLA